MLRTKNKYYDIYPQLGTTRSLCIKQWFLYCIESKKVLNVNLGLNERISWYKTERIYEKIEWAKGSIAGHGLNIKGKARQ